VIRRRLFLGLILVGAGVPAATLPAQDDASPTASATACYEWLAAPAYRRQIAAIRPLVPKMKMAFAAPGLGVAIAVRGKLVWSETCGLADRERGRPVTRTTLFRIGSVSKPLTAAAAARLAQSGKLDLDAPVQRYVPSFPEKNGKITLRALGGHLAGIRHYHGAEALSSKHYASVTDALRVFADDPLVSEPGSAFFYSSYGFNLLGAALEGAERRPYATVVRETLFDPLGMASTRPDVNGNTIAARARFYEISSARAARPAPSVDLSNRYPSGGLLSTAEDLARFGSGVTNPAFFSPRTQTLLFSSQQTAAGEATRYGFGFETAKSPVGPFAGHTGNVVGGTAFLLIHPRTRVVVALTTNIGFVTAPRPPDIGRNVPIPPQLALPFVRAIRAKG